MFEILKRFLLLDSSGTPLEGEFETVRDDGSSIQSFKAHVLSRCPNCHRPIRAQEIKGVCEYCREVMTCTMCFHLCLVCSRILCGRCARGQWLDRSRGSVVLCPEHFAQVQARNNASEALDLEKAAFERLTMLELQKLRVLESPIMEGRVLGLFKKGLVLKMLRDILQDQRQLRHDK